MKGGGEEGGRRVGQVEGVKVGGEEVWKRGRGSGGRGDERGKGLGGEDKGEGG